jgi:hypothetical protein
VIECNLYQYTGNNPVGFVDYSGLEKAKSWQQAEIKAMNRLKRNGHRILFGYKAGSRVQATRDGYSFMRNFDVVSLKDGVYYLTEVKYREKMKRQKSTARKIARSFNPIKKVEAAMKVAKSGHMLAQLYHDAALDSDIELSGNGIGSSEILLSELDGEVRVSWELWSSDKDDKVIDFTALKEMTDIDQRKERAEEIKNDIMDYASVQ